MGGLSGEVHGTRRAGVGRGGRADAGPGALGCVVVLFINSSTSAASATTTISGLEVQLWIF